MLTTTERIRAVRVVARGAVVAALSLGAFLAICSPPAGAATTTRSPGPVALIGVPDLRWTDLAVMPTMRALVTTGAVGVLSVRSEGEATRCGDALLELSAGTRVPSGVTGCDLDAQQLQQLRAGYRHSRYAARIGLLGDSLSVAAAAVQPAAGVVLAGAAAPANVVGTIGDALRRAKVVVAVDAGIYDGVDRRRAAAEVDARLASTLRALPADTTVMVAGISDGPRGGPHLHPLVIAGPGWTHHALRSATTGRAPYVQLFDLSATLLSLTGTTDIPRPMSGRPVTESSVSVGSIATYADVDLHARRALSVGHPTFSALCGVLIGALLLLFVRPALAEWPARLLVAAPLATWLIQLVPWWRWSWPAYVGLLVALSGVGAVVTSRLQRRSWQHAAMAVPAVTAAVLLVDQVVGAHLQLAAPFGDNPLVAGRFHGMGNIAFGVTMGALLVVTGLLVAGRGRRATSGLILAVGAVAIVVDGAPQLGDDIGGVVTLVPALAVLLALSLDVRVSWRRAVAVGAAAVALAVGLGLVDYARPQSRQTHAGRFIGDLLHGGAWTTVHRKADAVLGSLGTPAVTLLVLGVVVLVVLVWRRRIAAPPLLRSQLGPAAAAVVTLGVIGSLLNDSGIFVAAAALLAFAPPLLAATLGDTGSL